jgi:hypothetical protein
MCPHSFLLYLIAAGGYVPKVALWAMTVNLQNPPAQFSALPVPGLFGLNTWQSGNKKGRAMC